MNYKNKTFDVDDLIGIQAKYIWINQAEKEHSDVNWCKGDQFQRFLSIALDCVVYLRSTIENNSLWALIISTKTIRLKAKRIMPWIRYCETLILIQ